jgi:hypothetical protein
MSKLLGSFLVFLGLAYAAPNFVAASERCQHPGCGPVCRLYVIESHRAVPEVCYREIKIKVCKPRCQTDLVLEKSQVVKPAYQPLVEPGHATVLIPVCHHKTCFEVCHELRPETTHKTVTVDDGHWCTVCRKCHFLGGKTCEQVWVPNYGETCVPTTELVCRDVVVPTIHEECRDVPTQTSFPIHTLDRRLEKEDVYRHVPVTTEKWVEEEIVIRVPFVTSRCVSSRQVFESDDARPNPCPPCGPECGRAAHRPAGPLAAPTAPINMTPTHQSSPQSPPVSPAHQAIPKIDL